jgi:hypothetical protein
MDQQAAVERQVNDRVLQRIFRQTANQAFSHDWIRVRGEFWHWDQAQVWEWICEQAEEDTRESKQA